MARNRIAVHSRNPDGTPEDPDAEIIIDQPDPLSHKDARPGVHPVEAPAPARPKTTDDPKAPLAVKVNTDVRR